MTARCPACAVAALKEARDLLARIEEAQEFDTVTGETTIHPGEVLDGIGATVDRIDEVLRAAEGAK